MSGGGGGGHGYFGGSEMNGWNTDNGFLGSGGDDYFDGGAGEDQMWGYNGNDTLYLGAGNEGAYGGNGRDKVWGGAGNDAVFGQNGDDTVWGGTEHDWVAGGSGHDQLLGDDGNLTYGGNDTMEGDAGNDTMWGEAGHDLMYGDIGLTNGTSKPYNPDRNDQSMNGAEYYNRNALDNNDLMWGGSGNDAMYGQEGNDTLYGEVGDDYLDGGVSADTMSGGSGNDSYVVDNVGDLVTELANEGIDTVRTSLNNYTLAVNVENMTLLNGAIKAQGNTANNIIYGTAVANDINGAAGNDTLYGYGGDDTLDGGVGNDTMDGGAGNNTYAIDSSKDRVIQSLINASNKVLLNIASDNDPALQALDPNDKAAITKLLMGRDLTAAELANVTVNFSGPDRWTGTEGNDTRTDLSDRDSLYKGLGGDDTLNGGGGNDTLEGGQGNDSLNGGTGTDSLDGGEGADTLVGGVGDDVYVVDSDGDLVTELLNQGKDTVQSYSQFYQLGANIENLTLMNGAIYGFGNELANTITGNAADNYLNGGGGNDTLVGGSGNDTLEGGSGADSMDGGSGNNTYIIDQAGDRFSQSTIDANNTVTLNVDAFIGFNPDLTDSQIIQALSGSALSADQLKFITLKFQGDTNFQGNDDINNGDNFRDTGRANSFLSGRKGNDTLDGAAGNDTVKGDEGNDVLIGGKGNDDLYGGNGADVFRWEGSDVNLSQMDISYADVIKDFNAGGLQISTKTGSEADTLDLSGLLARLGYDASSSNANLNTLSNFLKVENSASNTVFSVDLDGVGSGTALQTITLEGTRLSSLDLAELQSRGVLHA